MTMSYLSDVRECGNPLEKLKLESLSLHLIKGVPKKRKIGEELGGIGGEGGSGAEGGSGEEDQDPETDQPPIGAFLDCLPLKSLELSGQYLNRKPWEVNLPRPASEIPSLSTTPILIKILVDLRIQYLVDPEYVEYLLFHGRCLECLRLDQIVCRLVESWYPPLIQSSDQMSPHLRSVTLAFDSLYELRQVRIS